MCHRDITGDLMPPSVGREMMVSMGPRADRKQHFFQELTSDSNMGAKKRGVKASRGRNRVMSRSTNTMIRRRSGVIEMTIKRNTNAAEMDSLIGKLTSHRLSTHVTWVYLLHGGRDRKVGKLSNIDLEKLRRKIMELLRKHREVGIRLVDEGEGRMHRPDVHRVQSANFNNML